MEVNKREKKCLFEISVFIVPMRDGRHTLLEGKIATLVSFYRPYEGWKTLIGKKDLMSGELFLSSL